MARGAAAKVFSAGNHGSTYGGNPLACATALAVVNTLIEQNLLSNATAMGQIIRDEISNSPAASEFVVEIRGKGLMLGIELDRDCPELVGKALERGLLINVTAGNTIRLLPPLIINAEQAHLMGSVVAGLISEYAEA